MLFRVLGPVQVWDGTAWTPVRAAQQRAVLAVLLVEAGRVVSTDRLVDELWGARPPRTAVKVIHGYVMRLRRALAGGAALETHEHGYRLALGDGDLDASVFATLAGAGRNHIASGRLAAGVAALDEALALWRGPALDDVPATTTVTAEARRLELARLTAVEDRLAAQLDLGRHALVVDELQRLVGEHPLREGLRGRLMLALYRCGRRADALAAYRQGREVLRADLGLEPGADLAGLHRAILAGDPVLAPPEAVPRPAQLPPDTAGFTGRDEHLRRLDALRPPAVLAITGPAGVGKTALAVHWAHRAAGRFDGHLYVDLRGFSGSAPVRPIDALARFLRALDVPAPDVPDTVDEAAAVYRSAVFGRRVLVVLDNAAGADQVRPLLPAGPGCLTLVTSRERLAGLVAHDGAAAETVGVLTAAEAGELLHRLLGSPDPACADLARLCGHLPLALRIAAATLAARPAWTVAEYAAALASGDRLSALAIERDGDRAVRVAFDHSYARLPPAPRRLFRLLGVLPGVDVTAATAAALAGVTAGQAGRLLDRLALAHLVDEHAPGRYAMHDLLRLYATERCGRERHAALDRVFRFYIERVDAAAEEFYPQVVRLPRTGRRFDDPGAWLEAERANLVAAASLRHPATWRLADALRGHLYQRMHLADWAVVAGAALASAEADGDPGGRAAAHLSLGALNLVRGRYGPAVHHHGRAVALAREADWADGESAALANLGALHANLGRSRLAADHLRRAMEIDRRTGRLHGQALKLANLALFAEELGRPADAAEHATLAMAVARQCGAPMVEVQGAYGLGVAYRALGRLDDAREVLEWTLDRQRALGLRNAEGDTTRALAAVHRDAGRLTEARRMAEAALAVARDAGDRRIETESLIVLAGVWQAVGRPAEARREYETALAMADEIGIRALRCDVLVGLARLDRAAGRADRARARVEEALTIARRIEHRGREAEALAELGAVRQSSAAPRPNQPLRHRR